MRLVGLAALLAVAACGGGKAAPAPAQPTAAAPTDEPAEPADEWVGVGAELDDPPPPEPDDLDDDLDDPPPPEPEPITREYTPSVPGVKLVSKGKGKRATLRYLAHPGDPFNCDMIMDMSLAAAARTVVVPTTTQGWSGKVTEVGGEEITATVVIDQLDVAHSADPISEQVGLETRTKLAPLLGATVISTMSDRGIPLRSSITTRGELDPLVAMGMQIGASGGIVLPKEPIGVGARWQVTRSETVGPALTESTSTFELVDRSGGIATIRGTVEVVATPLAVGPPTTAHGTVEAQFTGGLCFSSTVVTTTAMPPPVSATMTAVIVTRQR